MGRRPGRRRKAVATDEAPSETADVTDVVDSPPSLPHAESSQEFDERFDYAPSGFVQRLFTSIGGKTRLASSRIVELPYRWWLRWVLVGILVVVTTVFTPGLLPKWLGFKWSTTEDFCEKPKEKLRILQNTMNNLSKVMEGRRFIEQNERALSCMHDSAREVWNGPMNGRVLYPDDCTPKNAMAPTKKRTVCVGGEVKRQCFLWKCVNITTERKCTTVAATDPEAERRLGELAAKRRQIQSKIVADSNETKEATEEIVGTADKASEKVIKRLLRQVDVASNMYIVYTMVAIIIGRPLVIFKRERTSHMRTAALNLKRYHFVAIVVVILTLYDAGQKVLVDTEFKRLFRNFQHDPCYLDPKFSKARLDLIRRTCAEISLQRGQLEDNMMNMTTLFYDVQLCEVSAVGKIKPHPNEALINNVEHEREMYNLGNETGYTYPGNCNETHLNEATSISPDANVKWYEAILGSGILAQLLLKGIITNFLMSLIAFVEPMAMHRGLVEIFGMGKDCEGAGLSKKEEAAVRRFARDKFLFPLIMYSMLLVFEIAIVVYSVYVTKYRKQMIGVLSVDPAPPPAVQNFTYECSVGSLLVQPIELN